MSYPSSTKTLIWEVVKPRVIWSVPVKTLVGTGVETCTGFILACEAPSFCYSVETCGAPVDVLISASGGSAPDSDTTCKIKRCKKFSSLYHISRPQSMAVFLDCPRIHQLAATTQLQVDQTCPVISIFSHMFSQRIFNDLNQLGTFWMEAICERFELIVLSFFVPC